jgi:aspartyl-tRNA(Asn)/glutamyl-tRNA(Gln) amidotransferase subunit A
VKLHELTIHEAQALMKKGEASSVELTQAAIERILAVDNGVKAYLTLTPELALEQAREADERRARGENAPLLGVPLAIKDVICVEGVTTTCGSRILENFVPP